MDGRQFGAHHVAEIISLGGSKVALASSQPILAHDQAIGWQCTSRCSCWRQVRARAERGGKDQQNQRAQSLRRHWTSPLMRSNRALAIIHEINSLGTGGTPR